MISRPALDRLGAVGLCLIAAISALLDASTLLRLPDAAGVNAYSVLRFVAPLSPRPIATLAIAELALEAGLVLCIGVLVRRLASAQWPGLLAALLTAFSCGRLYLAVETPILLLALTVAAWAGALWANPKRSRVGAAFAATLAGGPNLRRALPAALLASLWGGAWLHARSAPAWPTSWTLPVPAAALALLVAAGCLVAAENSKPDRLLVLASGVAVATLALVLNPFLDYRTSDPSTLAGTLQALAPPAIAILCAAIATFAWRRARLWAAAPLVLAAALAMQTVSLHAVASPGMNPAFLLHRADLLAEFQAMRATLPPDAEIIAPSSDDALISYALGRKAHMGSKKYLLLAGAPAIVSNASVVLLHVNPDGTASALVPEDVLAATWPHLPSSQRAALQRRNPELRLGL